MLTIYLNAYIVNYISNEPNKLEVNIVKLQEELNSKLYKFH